MGAILRSQATTIMLLSAAGTARGCFPTEPGNPRPALRAPPGERAAARVRGPGCSSEPRAEARPGGSPLAGRPGDEKQSGQDPQVVLG